MRRGSVLLRIVRRGGGPGLIPSIAAAYLLFAGAEASACSPLPPPPHDETAEQRAEREVQFIRLKESAARAALEEDRRVLQDSGWIYFGRITRIVSSPEGRPQGFPNTTIWVSPKGKAVKGRAPRSLKVLDAGGYPGICGGRTGYDYLPNKVGDEVLVLGGDTVIYRNYIHEIARVGSDRANRLISLLGDTPARP